MTELHNRCITGTKIGPILGFPSYGRTEFSVWAEMKGGLTPPEPAPDDVKLVGKDLEEAIILRSYPRLTGRKSSWSNVTVPHPHIPWAAATPDGFADDRGIDAKVVGPWQLKHWGDTADEIPEAIQLQMWWLMAVCDLDVWDVIAVTGTQARIYTIERDRQAEAAVIAQAEKWYQRYIVGDEIPPMGASEDAGRWLQQQFPRHKTPDIREATDEEIALLREYAGVRADQGGLKKRRDELENLLKAAVADREGLKWSEGRFTWRRCKDSEVVDWQSLAIHLLYQHYSQDEAERQAKQAEYTTTKAGDRRIYFRSDLGRELSDAA